MSLAVVAVAVASSLLSVGANPAGALASSLLELMAHIVDATCDLAQLTAEAYLHASEATNVVAF